MVICHARRQQCSFTVKKSSYQANTYPYALTSDLKRWFLAVLHHEANNKLPEVCFPRALRPSVPRELSTALQQQCLVEKMTLRLGY